MWLYEYECEAAVYKLTVVEDERDVRNRLISLIKKADSGFTITSSYETGIDAYEGILTDSPDLIVTDIKIPYINGIELIKMARQVFPLVKIIVVTGYNEFDYAKEAANLGVAGFISKPVTLEDISAVLKKARDELDGEYLTASSLERLSAFYKDSLPIVREYDLYRLSTMLDVAPAFEGKLQGSGVNLDYHYFAMCVFDFDGGPGGLVLEKHDVVFSSIRKSVADELEGMFDCNFFNRYEKLCLILKSDAVPDMDMLELKIDRAIQRVSRFSETPVSAGISNAYGKKDFALMVREAMRALEYRGVMGGGRVFLYGNSAPLSAGLPVDDGLIKELSYMIHFRTAEDCLARIDCAMGGANADSLYYIATGIINALMRACDNLADLYAYFGNQDNIYRRLFELKTEGGIVGFLRESAMAVRKINDNVITDNVDRNLRKVMHYIEEHYMLPDFDFDSLARAAGFSVSYISAMLRKRKNTSFIKILTGLRMEKALELLADPSLKLVDIAERLGYSDAYYFSHCFKKYKGVSPKEFREHGIS
jgi:two-component system response regulator YesN